MEPLFSTVLIPFPVPLPVPVPCSVNEPLDCEGTQGHKTPLKAYLAFQNETFSTCKQDPKPKLTNKATFFDI